MKITPTHVFIILLFFCSLFGCGSSLTSQERARLNALQESLPIEPSGVPRAAELSRSAYELAARSKLERLRGQITELRDIVGAKQCFFQKKRTANIVLLSEKLEQAEKRFLALELAPESHWQRFMQDVESSLFDLDQLLIDLMKNENF